MLFWSWPSGLISLWSGPREKRIFLMGINKRFINILCCAHLPVFLSSALLCLVIPLFFFSPSLSISLLHIIQLSLSLVTLSTFLLSFHSGFYMQALHVQTPLKLNSAYPAASALKERPAEAWQMSQHLCVGFSSTSISTCFSFFFPVRYKTDHNSWSVSLLKLQAAVT